MDLEHYIHLMKQGESIYHIHKLVNSPFPLIPDFIDGLRKANKWDKGIIPIIHVGDVIRIPKYLCGDDYNKMIENAWRYK